MTNESLKLSFCLVYENKKLVTVPFLSAGHRKSCVKFKSSLKESDQLWVESLGVIWWLHVDKEAGCVGHSALAYSELCIPLRLTVDIQCHSVTVTQRAHIYHEYLFWLFYFPTRQNHYSNLIFFFLNCLCASRNCRTELVSLCVHVCVCDPWYS